jgi:hypothetical protein
MTTMPAHHPSVTQPPPDTLPEEPTKRPFARRAMAGYVLSRMAALRLWATIAGHDIAHLAPLPPNAQALCNPVGIENAVIEYIIARRPEWRGKRKGKVFVTFTGPEDDIETIIITQGCLLTKAQRLNRLLPVGTEGEREEFIRQWLESNGNAIFLQLPLSCCVLMMSAGVSKDEYTWMTREDHRDPY